MKRCLSFVAASLLAVSALAQTATQPGTTPPDPDAPSFRVGALVFGDYTYQSSPETTDSAGNRVHASSFNISRAYINLFGQLNHWIGFRVTPDIARETGTGSSLSGSQDYRLKFAYAQFNLDDWTTKGSWVRFGVTQTPLIDYEEQIYRYRFQSATYTDREGYLFASDAGLSGHWVFPSNYGDVQAGYFNGEGWAHVETNNEKAFQIRTSVRPLPRSATLKGLRLTGFYDRDAYVSNAPRTRAVGQVTYESPRVNAGLDLLRARDRASITARTTTARGYSVWVTPKLTTNGWEALLRHDSTKPDTNASLTRKRNIAGIAYWFQHLKGNVSSALMVDYDSTKVTARADDTRYGLKMLISF